MFNVTFPSLPKLEPIPGQRRNFTLLENFTALIDGRPLVIPAGFHTDLASIPERLESLLGIDNDAPQILLPSILHDWAFSVQGALWPDRALTFTECNHLLEDGMLASGATLFERGAVFGAVELFGREFWDRRPSLFDGAGALFH